MSKRKRGGPKPDRWLHCPRKSTKLICNKFLAFKTPLSSEFDDQVSENCRFSVETLLASWKNQPSKLGLWIDLTNTSRFYSKKVVEKAGIKYLKLPCRGHGETPSPEQTQTFIHICKNFVAQNPMEIIGVHCTHGFNRTGFLISSYLVEVEDFSLDAALAEFADARPPGIYKGDYLRELYNKYDDVEDTPEPPERPAWCTENEDFNLVDQDEETSLESDLQEPASKRQKKDRIKKNPIFMAGVPGVKPVLDYQEVKDVQKQIQRICSWKKTGFPGSQPVSMGHKNIWLLSEKPYRVSWKADGTRYMMLVREDGQVYFADRDNNIFEVQGLSFPHVKERNRKLKDTLMDGEMVIDKVKNEEIPRYLVYDVIMYDGIDVSKLPFYPNRYYIIQKEIIKGRHQAITEGKLDRQREPFSVRSKDFYDLSQTGKFFNKKFTDQLSHEPDGLIFQPSKEPYAGGPCPEILKWKPSSLNSVDFKLKIIKESGMGILERSKGELYVGGLKEPFAEIRLIRGLKELNNKIIECKFENNQWIFMRERTDKSYPNAYKTAISVCDSIKYPITKEYLLKCIEERFTDDT